MIIRILVVSKQPDREAFDNLDKLFERYYCSSVMAATAIVEEISPRIVFLDSTIRGSMDFIKWLKRETGSAAVVMHKGQPKTDFLALGADSIMESPVSRLDICETISALSLLPAKYSDVNDDSNLLEEHPDRGFWEITEAYENSEESYLDLSNAEVKNVKVVGQEVISVWGAQGGAGRTTVSLLLAEALADFDVVLIDLCFKEGPGDINTLLDLPITPHIGRILDAKNDRRKGFADCLIKPKKASFAVIQPPPTIDQAENVSPDDVIELIDQARRMFQIVILDLPNDFSPVTLEAVDMSTTVLLMATNHSGAIARIESIKSFIRKDIVKALLLNRFDFSKGRARDIAHFLDMPLAGVIGSITNFEICVNKGRITKLSNNVTDNAINDILKLIFGLDQSRVSHRKTISGMLKAGLASINR